MTISISPVGSLHVTGGALGDVIDPVDVVDLGSGERSSTRQCGMQQQPQRRRYLSLAVLMTVV